MICIDLGKLGGGADNRSRTYDLRITNAMLLYFHPFKNLLLKQAIHYKTLCYEKHLLIKIDTR